MKNSLTLITFLICLTVSSRTITIEILDGFTLKPADNVLVELKSENGELLNEMRTNESGKATFRDIPDGDVILTVVAPNDGFNSLTLTNRGYGRKKKLEFYDGDYSVILYPNELFEDRLRKQQQLNLENGMYEADSTISYPSDTLELEAQFPGGNEAMKKFISKNVKYPEISRELGDQGRIYLQFIVEKNGEITQINALRPLTPELIAEGIRLIRSMPKWEPGVIGGKAVRARCTLPITFTLN